MCKNQNKKDGVDRSIKIFVGGKILYFKVSDFLKMDRLVKNFPPPVQRIFKSEKKRPY
jgi:hypothetical protein